MPCLEQRGYKYDEKAAVVKTNKQKTPNQTKTKTKTSSQENNDCTTSELVCCFSTAALHGADLKQGVQRLKPQLMNSLFM